MITITIEETDKDGRVLARHVASGPIDQGDAAGVGELLARTVGALMYRGETAAEVPLLLAAAGTHRASACTRALGRACESGGSRFGGAVKLTVDLGRLIGEDRSARFREREEQIFRLLGAEVR